MFTVSLLTENGGRVSSTRKWKSLAAISAAMDTVKFTAQVVAVDAETSEVWVEESSGNWARAS